MPCRVVSRPEADVPNSAPYVVILETQTERTRQRVSLAVFILQLPSVWTRYALVLPRTFKSTKSRLVCGPKFGQADLGCSFVTLYFFSGLQDCIQKRLQFVQNCQKLESKTKKGSKKIRNSRIETMVDRFCKHQWIVVSHAMYALIWVV